MSGRLANRSMVTNRLALYGGKAVRDTWLPYGHQSIDKDDIAAVVEVLRSDWITQGPKVEEFERALATYCGAQYGVAFSSGTAALHAACAAAGLSAEDEAITTPLTFVATANAVVYCGAKPVFADIREDTLNIDPDEVSKRITSRTKAIIPVDFAGLPADLDQILSLAKRHNLMVIEDACHALGAGYKGRKVGCASPMAVFSFHPVKHVTTGEGGMVVTNEADLAKRLRAFRHHGIDYVSEKPWQYEISELGYNYRLSDIHCALGLSQLQKLNRRIMRRREIVARYRQAFANVKGISLPSTAPHEENAWHLFVILLNLELLSVDRDTILQLLRSENIGATVHYPPVHLHPFYRRRFGYGEGLCPVAEAVSLRMITLPLFPEMSDDDAGDVIEAALKVVGASLL